MKRSARPPGSPFWHFAYEFEGGLAFSTSHHDPGLDTDDPTRPLQRFRHFMPYVVQSQGGTLRGKRILDIDIRTAVTPGMVAFPTRSAIEMMLRHAGVKRSLEIPVRTDDLPLEYRIDRRASWLIDV